MDTAQTKVLLLFSSSELGGAERSLTRMAAVRPVCTEYLLATLDGNGSWQPWAKSLGLRTVTLGRRAPSGAHGRVTPAALMRLVRLVRREGIRIIYVIGLRAAVLLRLIRPALGQVALVQGIRWNPASQSRLDKAFRIAEGWLGWGIDLYIANSDAARRTLITKCRIPEHKVRVIYNGVELPDRPPARRTADSPVAVTVANVSARKGYLEYLESVVRPLADTYPDARFVIIGRDDMQGRLQRRIEALRLGNRVSYMGFTEDVTPYLEAARAFVLPSLWNEGCPTSLLEAMVQGIPVVAYAIDGIPELVNNGEDGILVPPRDSVAMRTAIARLFDDPGLASDMGEAGYGKVCSAFSQRTMADRHAEIFGQLSLASA